MPGIGLDTLTAAPLTIELGGRPLRIAPLTIADLGELQAWINAQLIANAPDPIAIARRLAEGFPPEVQSELLREAYRDARDAREARPTAPIGTSEAFAVTGTAAGVKEILALALRKHQPDLTAEDLDGIVGSLLPGDLDYLFAHAFGTERPDGPKARGAGADATGPPTGPPSIGGSASPPTDSAPSRSAG
jgi:hypothetical protein